MEGGHREDEINQVLCDDLLYRILVFEVGAGAYPLLSRVCTRWRSIVAAAPNALRDGLVEKTAALCIDSGVRSVPLVCGWAARVRTLVARHGPHLLHLGHLIDAMVKGRVGVVCWARSLQHPWIECDPLGEDDKRGMLVCKDAPRAYDFCPRCARGRQADAWPWLCAVRAGRPEIVLDDISALVATRGPITARQRDCWKKAMCAVLIDLVREDNSVDVIERIVDAGIIKTHDDGGCSKCDRRNTIWNAAAAAGRLDVLEWGHSTARDAFIHPMFERPLCETDGVAVDAARNGHVHVIEWVARAHPADPLCAEYGHLVYWAALESGCTRVLDWIVDRCDKLVRKWDNVTTGNFVRESPWRAMRASTSASLAWLRARGVIIPTRLLERVRGDGGFRMSRLDLPGSAETAAYAVDVCWCVRPNTKALTRASRQDRLDLVCLAAERGWIDRIDVWNAMWAKAVDARADAVVDWFASHHFVPPPSQVEDNVPTDPVAVPLLQSGRHHHNDIPPPFRIGWGYTFMGLSGAMAVRWAAGAPWAADGSSIIEYDALYPDCAPAACILWALSKGCPMPREWQGLSKRDVMMACASAMVADKDIQWRHPCSIGLDAIAPLSCMKKSDATVAQAWIDVWRLVKRWARPPARSPMTDDLARQFKWDTHELRAGDLSVESMRDFVSTFWPRAHDPLGHHMHHDKTLSKRQRARLRHKRSKALGYAS